MNLLLDRYCKIIENLLVLLLALMVILVFGNVFLRYAFNSGIAVSEELSRWLFVWMTFLGAIIGVHERAHLGTDFLVGKLSITGKKIFFAISHILMIAICYMMFKGGWEQTVINWGTESATMGISVAWVSGISLIFSASAGLMFVGDLIRLFTGHLNLEELEIRESEEA
jgi:TRAP-type C4-dicarboxylate transport system permease small subunit